MLKPHVFPDHEAVSRHAAAWLVERLRENPAALVCLAAGATPMRTYELLADRGADEPALFNQCRFIKLDEWGGLAPADPAACETHLQATLIAPLGLAGRYVGFDGQANDPEAECARIASWLKDNGPIDTCVLGLGANGHLGFNEPAEFLRPHAHVAMLSQASLGHSTLAAAGARPTHGLTLGMADLLQARQIVLLVTGAAKREPMRHLLSGQITTEFPASLLQLHAHVALFCDTAADPCAEQR
jgi:galactosamine-6-phosphate isomerase